MPDDNDASSSSDTEPLSLSQDNPRHALQKIRTSEATKTSTKRKRGEEAAGNEAFENNDRKFCVLENCIRRMSFLYHAWQPAYLEVIREIFGEDLAASSSEFVEAKNRIINGIKNYKHTLISQCELHIRELYKETVLFRSIKRPEQLHTHFASSYNATNFLFVWNYMKRCLDVNRSSELGRYYCKSMYVNICVETKRWMNVKDSEAPDDVARGEFLAFYDLVTTQKDFDRVRKEDFRVLENRVRNERWKKKKPDVSGLDCYKSLGPPLTGTASPSTFIG